MDKLTITIEGLTDILKAVFKPATETSAPGTSFTLEEAMEGSSEFIKLATTPPAPPMTTETPAPPAPPAETEGTPAPPMTTETETPAPSTIVELDNNGVPWDARINTSSKGMTAKGIWKRKPRLEDDFYNGILAELKGAQAAPPVETETPAPPAATIAGKSETSVPTPPAESTITTFAELSESIMTKGVSNDIVTAAVNQVGLQSYLLLGGRPDLVPEVAKLLGL